MKLRRLGRTDLLVSELGFGAFAIGGNRSGNSYGPTDDDVSTEAVFAALDLGCTFFDTADVYGYGHSEAVLGRALRRAGRSADVVVASKVGGNFASGRTVMDFSAGHIVRAVEDSLRRLQRGHIDLYQLHNPSRAVIEAGEAIDALDRLKAAGKIRHYGISIHKPEEGRAALRDGRPQTLQLVHNLLMLLEPAGSCQALLEETVAADIGVIAREPLAGGFLSGRHGPDRCYGEGDLRAGWPAGRRRLYAALADTLRGLERPGVSLAQAALRYALDEPAVATVIVGIKTPAQAIENFAACTLPPFEGLAQGRLGPGR